MLPTQPEPTSHSTVPRLARLGVAALGLALFAAAMWFAWLGWDHDYYEVDGVAQGPYRAWQVLGCGLSITVAAVLAHLWLRSARVIPVLAGVGVLGFAVPWALDAASSDDSGLWVVGLLFLLIGGGLGLAMVLALTAAIASAFPRRS